MSQQPAPWAHTPRSPAWGPQLPIAHRLSHDHSSQGAPSAHLPPSPLSLALSFLIWKMEIMRVTYLIWRSGGFFSLCTKAHCPWMKTSQIRGYCTMEVNRGCPSGGAPAPLITWFPSLPVPGLDPGLYGPGGHWYSLFMGFSRISNSGSSIWGVCLLGVPY